MIRCRMVGGGFQHQESVSIHNKLPKDFVWVKNNGEYDISIHIDDGMRIGLDLPKKDPFICVDVGGGDGTLTEKLKFAVLSKQRNFRIYSFLFRSFLSPSARTFQLIYF